MNKRTYTGNWSTVCFCQRCEARLDVRKAVWLAFDQRTGTYTDQEIPDEFNQGGFSFGKDCAETAKAEHLAAQGVTS